MPAGESPPVLVIAGPTAVGKTDVAVAAALELGAEIISADAMQVYRGLDIGTDKPSMERRRGVIHHLLDVAEPWEPFSAARYRDLAREALRAVRARGHLAVVCGGTGLYLRALLDDLLPSGPGAPDPAVRAGLEELARRVGPHELHRRLAAVDPRAAERIHAMNVRRVIRALEVWEATGVPMSEWQRRAREEAHPVDAVWVALIRPRDELYARIDGRVDDQVSRGLVDETRRLLARGLSHRHTAMQALGYKEMARYLAGRVSFGQAVESLKLATRRYAKRQATWFRADPRITWVDASSCTSVDELASAVVDLFRRRSAGGGGCV